MTGGHGGDSHGSEGYCNAKQQPRSHDTSRIAWAKLMARVGEEVPLECPACGGDIRFRGDGRQEPAHFEPEVRKRAKDRMASSNFVRETLSDLPLFNVATLGSENLWV